MKRVRCVVCGLMKEGKNAALPAITNNGDRVNEVTCDAHRGVKI